MNFEAAVEKGKKPPDWYYWTPESSDISSNRFFWKHGWQWGWKCGKWLRVCLGSRFLSSSAQLGFCPSPKARGLFSGESKRTGLWPGKNKILLGPGFLYSEIQDLSKILYIKLWDSAFHTPSFLSAKMLACFTLPSRKETGIFSLWN